MQKFMLGLILSAGAMGSVLAGDGKTDAPPRPKPVTVYEPQRSGDSSCGCDKGFFHPFTKFWVKTVGGNMAGGMKSGASHVKHGIGGGGD